MSQELDQLTQTVHDTEGVIDSAIAFISGLQAQIIDAAGDKAATLAIAQELGQKKDQLAAAIAA